MGSTSVNLKIPIISICVTASVATAYWIFKRLTSSGKVQPKKWIKVGSVKKLLIYPIKSCQGIETEKAILTTLGLKCPNANIRDRDFLLVDGNGRQLTMGSTPRLALVQVKIEDDKLCLTAPNMLPLTFNRPKPNGRNERTCKIKQDTKLKALDCGDEVAQWFQKYLGNDHVRLCFHHLDKSQRSFEPYMLKCPQFGRSDFGSFQNATAYLLVAEESVNELNTRLDKKCTYKNFRPTILIEGVSEPFAEVNWSYLRIGHGNKAVLNVAAPCHRCPITTVDQESGVLTGDGEPLKTLRKMNINKRVVDDRLREVLKNRGVLGLRLGLHIEGDEPGDLVTIGDPVYVALL